MTSVYDQADWCEPCQGYHLHDHEDLVPTPCGVTALQGYDVVLECARPPGHEGHHITLIGQSWDRPP